jgi:hypothetical protein
MNSPNDKIPGLNAPMTSGQKWSLFFVFVVAGMNLLALYLLITGRMGL